MEDGLAVTTDYHQACVAAETLQVREKIKPLVEEWWQENGWGMTSLPQIPNAAVLARQLATFRYEDAVFASMSEEVGLVPVWFSYTGDKFSTESKLKRSYLHPVYCDGCGRNKGLKLRTERLVADMNRYSGRTLDQISTLHGVSLVEYHHEHLQQMYPDALTCDNTQWLKKIGTGANAAKKYYCAYLSLFLAHAVLFEDYHGGESGTALDNFTSEVFEPAYAEVAKLFGVSPLIVKLPWWNELQYYPANSNWKDHGVRLS